MERGQAWAGIVLVSLVLLAVAAGVVLRVHGPFHTVRPASRTARTSPPASVEPPPSPAEEDLDQIRECVRELVDVAGKTDLSYPERNALLSACNGV